MQKSSLTETVLTRIGSRPAFSRARLVGWAFLIAVLLSTISYLGRTALDTAFSGHSASTELHEINLGGHLLLVPENLIRRRSDRRSGEHTRLDLYMRWPSLEGYSYARRASFQGREKQKEIVFVTIVPSSAYEISMEQAQAAYLDISVPAEPFPTGLAIRQFQQGSGFENEVLAVGERMPETPFLARCLAGQMAEDSLAPCERRLPFVEGLYLVYRFPGELLPEWRLLDDMLSKRLTALLQRNG
jgi:hypothetical protein